MDVASRQTISNWENDKSYPDVHSLMLLCDVFNVSLDQLIKGDAIIMREQISGRSRMELGHLARLFSALFFSLIVTPLPLYRYLKAIGVGV